MEEILFLVQCELTIVCQFWAGAVVLELNLVLGRIKFRNNSHSY